MKKFKWIISSFSVLTVMFACIIFVNLQNNREKTNANINSELTKLNKTSATGDTITDGNFIFTELADGTYSVKASSKSINGNIIIPDEYNGKAVTEIAASGFASCRNIMNITIGNNIKKIGNYAFNKSACNTSYGTNRKLTIPYGVETIGNYAFASTHIGGYDVLIPDSVTSIGSYAFQYARMPSLTMSNNITTIPEYCFYNCSYLKSIIFSNNLERIDRYAFQYNYLTAISLPDSLKTISNYAFGTSYSLTTVSIPKNVNSLHYTAFNGCKKLTTITVVEDNLTYDSRDNSNAVIETSTNTLIHAINSTVIPNSVEKIGQGAFMGTTITNLIIPDSVKEIGTSCFSNCNNLTSITLRASIGTRAFYACQALTNIQLNEGVKQILGNAFEYCSALTELRVPNSCESISSDIFLNSGVKRFYVGSGLKTIGTQKSSRFDVLVVDENNPFLDSRENCNAIIETATNKLILGCNETVIPDGVEIIGTYAFYGASLAGKSLVIPDSLISIESNAFYNSGLSQAVFLNPKGWYSGSSANTAVAEETLANPSTAASTISKMYAVYTCKMIVSKTTDVAIGGVEITESITMINVSSGYGASVQNASIVYNSSAGYRLGSYEITSAANLKITLTYTDGSTKVITEKEDGVYKFEIDKFTSGLNISLQ